MKITLNNQTFELSDDSSCCELVAKLGLTDTKLALELNGNIIAKSNHTNTILNTGDRVEVVLAVGGG